jgi:hypothetical protein
VIDESDLQFEKLDDPRISILFDINIDSSDDDENDKDSIRIKRELHSNTIDLSGECPFLPPKRSVGRGKFRIIIESGIQTRRTFGLLSVQCATGFIKPLLTTIRRS